MDRTQRLVVALLIVAVVFSVLAMMSAFTLSDIDFGRERVQQAAPVQGSTGGYNAAGVGLEVIRNSGGVTG